MADVTGTLTTFLTQMVALSVATERVIEIIKQWFMSAPTTEKQAATRTWVVQLIAVFSGILVVALSGLNPIGVSGFEPVSFKNPKDWACWVVGGFLVSGGSAFWNHLLDILKATKVEKETAANQAAATADQPKIPA